MQHDLSNRSFADKLLTTKRLLQANTGVSQEGYCPQCLEIDQKLSKLYDPQRGRDDSIVLNPLGRRGSDSCSSCRDLACIQDVYALKDHRIGLMDGHSVFRVREESMESNSTGAFYHHPWWYYLSHDSYDFHPQDASLDVDVFARFDIASIKRWLSECDESHEACILSDPDTLGLPLLLIDVIEECVTLRPAGSRYVALSYVWGNSSVTKLTTKTAQLLQRSGGLSASANVNIPRTIREAMRLVSLLVMRYLWVDCLCIVQDGLDLPQQLTKMHLIYSDAYLTVVAARSKNADAGLFDLDETGSRKLPGHTIKYANHTIGITPQLRDAGVMTNPWSERAWTLQEAFFSRRLLVFHDLVHMICHEDIRDEGDSRLRRWVVQSDVFHFFCVAPGNKMRRVRSDYPRWWQFTDMQEEYNRRKLTYDYDVMRAFLGLAAFFESRNTNDRSTVRDRFLHGHPVENFQRSLMWSTPPNTGRMRDFSKRPLGLAALPTWSWGSTHHATCKHTGALFGYSREGPKEIMDLDKPTEIKIHCHPCHSPFDVREGCCADDLSHVALDDVTLRLYIQAQRAAFSVTLDDLRAREELPKKNYVCIPRLDGYHHERLLQDAAPDLSLMFIGLHYCHDYAKDSLVNAVCVTEVPGQPGRYTRVGIGFIKKDAWDEVAVFDENIVLE